MAGIPATVSVRHELNQIVKLSRNAEFVRDYLTSGIKLRSFGETLSHFARESDASALQTRLTDALSKQPGAPPRDSVRRKVSMWLSGKNAPDDRGQLIRIAFALGLDETEAQNFMATAGEGTLHQRNPEELSYIFALRNSLSYGDALALYRDIAHIIGGGGESVTRAVADRFKNVRSYDEFITFISRERENLGGLHNTAYAYFRKYMDVLASPETDAGAADEKRYTVREIIETYMPAPAKPRRGEDSLLKSALRRHWPDEATISKIINRTCDVPRKALVLLFIATDGADTYERAYQSESLTRRQAFVDRYRRISLMLDDCGFSPPDPRGHFDWLALYCMCAEEDADANARMRGVLADIFDI